MLRIASTASLAHPSLVELLKDSLRLHFAEIELCGEGSALKEIAEQQMQRIRGVTRVFVALYAPDAARHDAHVGRCGSFEATLSGFRTFTEIIGAQGGVFAVLHDASMVADFAEAWQDGSLPGRPLFRLSAVGDSLVALATVADGLPKAARLALFQLIPRCLLPYGEVVPLPWKAPPGVSGSDCRGSYASCPHSAVCEVSDQCPGLATGWSCEGIAPIVSAT
ncbi:MAG: hypothetical protein HN348_17135 [Proteobacteria bacterium]|nr:hypothetical protein [Pseudomonadota bacterium]